MGRYCINENHFILFGRRSVVYFKLKPPPPSGTPGLLLAGKVKGQSSKVKVQLEEEEKTIEIKIYD